MANLSSNPARVALLTAMAESTDNGAKVWDEQPAIRNSTKNALLQSGYVKIANKKAAITPEGRAALTKATLDTMALPTPAAEAPKGNGAEAKAKFEAARAEVVKPAKAKAEKPATKRTAVEAAQPAANPPEQKVEPVQQAEQPAAAPQEEGTGAANLGYRLQAIISDVYGVNYLTAPTLYLIWAASQMADIEGVEVARKALADLNRDREAEGSVPALPPYGSKLFR